jgi:hypothetical protein
MIHYAAEQGRIDAMRVLIQKGFDVNALTTGGDKYTALHLVARKGHVDVAKVLLQNGADVNRLSNLQYTPLSQAVGYGHVDMVRLLIRNGANVNDTEKDDDYLSLSIYDGSVEIANVLIQNGANVNIKNSNNWTPLHHVAHQGKTNYIRLLLENGADVDAECKCSSRPHGEKVTPLHIAAYNQKIECALQLVCFGATIGKDISWDKTKLIRPIRDGLNLLRDGKNMKTTLMSVEERRFMLNLALLFCMKHGAIGSKIFSVVRSLITFHGIFMARGYERGAKTIWKKKKKVWVRASHANDDLDEFFMP